MTHENRWTTVISNTKEGYAVYRDPESPGGFCTDSIIAFAAVYDDHLGNFLVPLICDSELGADLATNANNFSHYHWGPLSEVKI